MNRETLKKEFIDEYHLDIGNIQTMNEIANYWLDKMQAALDAKVFEIRGQVLDAYMGWNDGCGCCSSERSISEENLATKVPSLTIHNT